MKFFKLIKPGDIILFILIMLSAVLVSFVFFGKTRTADAANTAKTVVITKNGTLYESFDLSENRTVDMGSNVIVTENGYVYMKSADCKNRICVNTGKINSAGQSIVCLPNRIMVKITGKEDSVDAVTK